MFNNANEQNGPTVIRFINSGDIKDENEFRVYTAPSTPTFDLKKYYDFKKANPENLNMHHYMKAQIDKYFSKHELERMIHYIAVDHQLYVNNHLWERPITCHRSIEFLIGADRLCLLYVWFENFYDWVFFQRDADAKFEKLLFEIITI